MLINSLLLFIQETLPICILYAYLCTWHALFDTHKHSLRLLEQANCKENTTTRSFKGDHHIMYTLSIFIGLVVSSTSTEVRQWLGMTLDGIGYEVVLMVITVACVACVLLAPCLRKPLHRKIYFSFSLFLIVLPHASDFQVFLSSVPQAQVKSIVYVAMSIGLGICISISYLLFFLFMNLNKARPFKLAIAVFLAAQLSSIVVILQQIDLLSSSLPLWNSNYLIADKSEYGQFFHALFGYDATPTLLYLIALGLFSFFIFIFLMKSPFSKNTTRGVVQ
jgi:high-affinity iron transporter